MSKKKKTGFIPAKIIGTLPDGYEYKIINSGRDIQVVGVASDKVPVCFRITEDELIEIKLFKEATT